MGLFMDKKEKNLILDVIERLTRLEEQMKAGFKRSQEQYDDIKDHMSTINDETGKLQERVTSIEKLYHQAKARYERSAIYWKIAAFIASPAVTFLIICLIKHLIGLPIP